MSQVSVVNMEEKEERHLNGENKICTEVIIQEPEKVNIEDATKPQEVEENKSEVYADAENGNEVITIVAQENDGQIYIYERGENEVHPENISEFIQVCDSNNTFEEINHSQNEDVNVDVCDEGKEEEEKGSSSCKKSEEEKSDSKETNKKNEDSEQAEEGETINCNLNDNALANSDGSQLKNYKSVILEDWEVEVPHILENHESENLTETIVAEEPPSAQILNSQELIEYNNDNCTVVEVTASERNEIISETKDKEENPVSENQTDSSASVSLEGEILKLMSDKKVVDPMKYSNSIVSKEDIVKILDKSTERVVRPIVTGKDLFFSIELTKKLNQKLAPIRPLKKNLGNEEKSNVANESEPCNNNNMVDCGEQVGKTDCLKGLKSTPGNSAVKENGNETQIGVAAVKVGDSKTPIPGKPPKKTPIKRGKLRTMDKELERMIALQQLREEFPSTRKRSRTTKKVNHIPFLASTVLEKALTSPEVTTALKPGPPKRRPCYLPENVSYAKSVENAETEKSSDVSQADEISANKVDGEREAHILTNFTTPEKSQNCAENMIVDLDSSNSSTSNAIVRTYSAKRKSTDAENDIKSTLETIAAVTKALSETNEEINESKPKKQKTVTQSENKNKNNILIKKKKKLKVGNSNEKKRNLELEKLLGDEGAVRMLYDTQHGEDSSVTPKKPKLKTTTGLKKDLMLKTKLVKNAVMRLSGVGAEGVTLRGKRRPIKSESDVNTQESEPLFSSTPNIVLYKPKKKQRAEASRILYRHSSSESFDSSEGYRRTSFDADGLNTSTKEGSTVNGGKQENSSPIATETEKLSPKAKPRKAENITTKKLKKVENIKHFSQDVKEKVPRGRGRPGKIRTQSFWKNDSKLNLSNVPIRKSSRPRMVSKKYSIWSSTSMDSLSVESLGLKKMKKASVELGKKLNCKDLTVLQYEQLVQIVLTPTSTLLKNSLNQEVLEELKHVFTFLSEESSCKAVLLSSNGSTFCQGVDLNQIISFNENEKKNRISQLVKAIREFITCLYTFRKPVIVGVHEGAIGLGVTLLPFCDLVVSSDKASFYTPYVKLGQAPEGAPTHTFPGISRRLVTELLIKSHKMTATDALKHGLVTQVIPEERFNEELLVISRNVAAQPVQGIQSIKLLLRSGQQEEIEKTLRMEGELLEESWNSTECLNNMIRFLNSGEVQLKKLDKT